MHRLLTFFAACVLSGVMAFAQSTATDQAAAGGTQPSGNSTSAVPNNNGTSPSSAQGQPSRTPSTPNQAQPGENNPANAGTRDGRANGTAVRPNADSRSANPPDSSDNNGIKRDDTGSNPASPHAPATSPNTGTRGVAPWLWIALGVIAIIALISALSGRNRAETDIDDRDPRWRTPREPDVIRREEIYRARRDDIDSDEDQIRRAS
jgi:hypothetical protein